MINQKSRAGIS